MDDIKQRRKEIIQKLSGDANGWTRFEASYKQSWGLHTKSRVGFRIIMKRLKEVRSLVFTDLYKDELLKTIYPNNNTRRHFIGEIIMLMWKLNLVRLKFNNGYKVISWSDAGEENYLKKMQRKRE